MMNSRPSYPFIPQDMPFMFGIPASNARYTLQAVRSMALQGGVRRLFIFYLEGIDFTESTCRATINYVDTVLIQLKPDFQIVGVMTYTIEEQFADREIFRNVLVPQAIRLGADAVIGCDGEVSRCGEVSTSVHVHVWL